MNIVAASYGDKRNAKLPLYDQTCIALVTQKVRVEEIGPPEFSAPAHISRDRAARSLPVISGKESTRLWMIDLRMMKRYAFDFAYHVFSVGAALLPSRVKAMKRRGRRPVDGLNDVALSAQITEGANLTMDEYAVIGLTAPRIAATQHDYLHARIPL
jgi:hypothetical protein